jgi:hypothetical protein
MIPEDIRKAYAFYREKMFGEAKEFPLGTERDETGAPYLELSPDGKMAILGRDRGEETFRQETYSVDELMYFLFRKTAFSRALSQAPTDKPYKESERIAAEELGKLNPAWKVKFFEEQAARRAAGLIADGC